MAEIEMAGEDVNAFRELAHREHGAASLSAATSGRLERSRRHHEVRCPNGLGDELRAVLRSDSRTWGALSLLRGADSDHFEPTDSATVASVSAVLAEGVRRAMLLADPPDEHAGTSEPAGLAQLAADYSLITADAAAERWLAELQETASGAPLPPVVTAVATRARSISAGLAEGDSLAKARVRAPSGRWLLVRASALGDEADAPLAVIIEPAPAEEVAPLMADAYDLSERERAVTRLVARGLSTNAIAACLYISSYTVQDHLKAIFDKVGVSTRGELVARLFFEHDAPRLSDA
jgi:DNA-binding CsgD family transcriptional regulator